MVSTYFKHTHDANACDDTLFFMKRRIASICPPVITAFVVSFVIRFMDIMLGGEKFRFAYVVEAIPEFLGLHGTGLHLFSVTGITWYISCMLISMLLLYYLLCRFQNTFLYIISPLTGLLITAYMYKVVGDYNQWENYSGIFSIGIIRAVGGLCLGCTTYIVSDQLSRIQFTTCGRVAITLFELFSYVCIFYGLFIYKYSFLMHSALTILLVPLVAVIMSKISYISSVFASPKWDAFGTASLWIYLSHWRIVMLFANHFASSLSFGKCFVAIWILTIILAFFEYAGYLFIKSRSRELKAVFIKEE